VAVLDALERLRAVSRVRNGPGGERSLADLHGLFGRDVHRAEQSAGDYVTPRGDGFTFSSGYFCKSVVPRSFAGNGSALAFASVFGVLNHAVHLAVGGVGSRPDPAPGDDFRLPCAPTAACAATHLFRPRLARLASAHRAGRHYHLIQIIKSL